MVNWIQGKDQVAVNLDPTFELPSPAEGGDLQTIQLATGTGVTLPTHDFYLFFPGGVGETEEYVYVVTRSGDTLSCGPDPFGVSPSTGRAAINPVRWPAAHHPAAARIELRNVFEVVTQLQERLDGHAHDGTTANGPVLTQAQGTNTVQVSNNSGGTLVLGDVVVILNGQATSVPSTGYLAGPVAVVCSPQGGPPTGAGDYSAANGASVYVRTAGVAWAKCASSVTAGNVVQTTNVNTVTNLVSPALGAIGFALTAAVLYSGGYYCQILLINRGSDLLTLSGVQDVKNKTIFSPVIYSSVDTTARMFFPAAVSNETLVGVAAIQNLTNKTLTSPVIGAPSIAGGTISGAAITATNAALTTPTITGGTISGAAITATNAALTTPTISGPAVTGGTFTSPTVVGGAFSSHVMTGGTYNTPSITTPTIAGLTTYTTAAARVLAGSTSLGVKNASNTIDVAVFNSSGRVDFPNQSCMLGTYSGGSILLDSGGTPLTIPIDAEFYDRLNEWSTVTKTFTPHAAGLYTFSISVTVTATYNPVLGSYEPHLSLYMYHPSYGYFTFAHLPVTSMNNGIPMATTEGGTHTEHTAVSGVYFAVAIIQGHPNYPVYFTGAQLTIARLG